MLESLAHSNYHAPRPRPIDPAVLYDLVKIRKLVDDATNLAVRAASGIASSAVMKDGGLLGGGAAGVLGLGIAGGGPAPRLSRERKHRMRELATQKLAKAYKLDEIAASVATMQSASSLEEVANLVLQRNPDDPDAKYVHFFHEKIPSRMLAKCTSLKPLDDVIAERPSEGAPLRTRAVTKGFKEDYVSAAADLTTALSICRTRHGHDTSSMVLGGRTGSNGSTRHGESSRTEEEDQPSSLEAQLLFHRASTYLTIASGHIEATLTPKVTAAAAAAAAVTSDASAQAAEAEANVKREAARKIVRTNAKRALRDFVKFLSNFDYTPGLPAETTEDFLKKVNEELNKSNNGRGMNGNDSNNVEKDAKKLLEIFYRQSNNHDGDESRGSSSIPNGRPGNGLPSPPVYPVSTLFTAPPASLPPYPCTALSTASSSSSTPTTSTSSAVAAAAAAFLAESNEAITYHPLLTDALHSVLLCHILIQTPQKELLRHAYMVARLARVCDGYPIFLAARSPARADWIEMLRKTNNHVGLESTWEGLCSPAPLPNPSTAPPSPAFQPSEQKLLNSSASSSSSSSSSGSSSTAASSALVLSKSDENKKLQLQQQQINTPKRWAQEDGGKEYPISTERASMIAKWVKDAAKREKARKDDPSSVPELTAPPRRKKSSPKIAAAKGAGVPIALQVVAVGCAEV